MAGITAAKMYAAGTLPISCTFNLIYFSAKLWYQIERCVPYIEPRKTYLDNSPVLCCSRIPSKGTIEPSWNTRRNFGRYAVWKCWPNQNHQRNSIISNEASEPACFLRVELSESYHWFIMNYDVCTKLTCAIPPWPCLSAFQGSVEKAKRKYDP